MNDAKKHRTKLYVDRNLQGRLALRISIYWLLYHVVLWHAMFFSSFLKQQERALAIQQKPVPFIELYAAFASQHRSLAICALAVSPMILWDIIRLSHRIAGPLVRLEGTLLRMARGETVRELKFRKGDWVVGLERTFNIYLASLPPATATSGASAAATEDQAKPSAGPPADIESPREFSRLLEDLEEVTQTVASIHAGSPQADESDEDPAEPHLRKHPESR